MRLRVFIAALIAYCTSGAASAPHALQVPVKLSLRWVDKRAYVTNAVVGGVSASLEVATTSSDVWLSCARVSAPSSYADVCRTTSCPAIITHGGVNACTSQTNTTLSLANGAVEVDEFPVNVVLDTRNATADKDGVLGLGLRTAVFGSMFPELLSNRSLVESVHNFSLYLTDAPGGNGSFIQLGGSFQDQLHGFDRLELSERGLTTRFSLPLRLDRSVGLSGWDLSVTAVRFGMKQLLYPREYSPSEVAGSDAVATVSVSDAVVKMPPSVFKYFRDEYLGTGCVVRDEGYSCETSVFASLPRVAIYIGDKIFYLEASDYSVQTSSDVLVLVSASASELRWMLGAPFIRKFPAMFSLPARCVDVLCQFSVSCDSTPLGDAWDRQYLPESSKRPSNSTMTIEEGGGMSTATSLHSPAGARVIMWMGFLFGILGFCLATISAVNRWRHRHDPHFDDNGTVASDKDLEELELAVRELSSTSESLQSPGSHFTPLASPLSHETQTR